MVFDFKNISANVEAFMLAKERAKPNCEDFIPNTWDVEIPVIKDQKRKHYWFYSTEPDKGKTTFLENVGEKFRCSWYNKSEIYQQIHRDS